MLQRSCLRASSEPPRPRHKKVLESQDPLTFSVGWRRFQSLSARAAGRAEMRTTERESGMERAFFTGAAPAVTISVSLFVSVWVFLFIGMR